MAITHDEFRAALGRFASGVTVVTGRDADNNLYGITVSAFSSVSLEPPLVLICIGKKADSHRAFSESGRFAVNVLGSGQRAVSEQFAFRTDDKFDGIGYRLGASGLPLIENCLANIECRVVGAHDGGDHTIFVGEVESAVTAAGNPLVYWLGDYAGIG
jgi:flavin reductase (DIM6/NTAB) family NADH-FMN oxidoreductase RutF